MVIVCRRLSPFEVFYQVKLSLCFFFFAVIFFFYFREGDSSFASSVLVPPPFSLRDVGGLLES